jgi:hypothetical protein
MGSNKYWCIGHRVFSRRAVIVIVSVYRLRGAEEKERRKDKGNSKEQRETHQTWTAARPDIDALEVALACGRFLFCWRLE